MPPRFALAIAAALLLTAVFAPQASAANFVVDNTADFSDGEAGDEVCFAPRVAACTLRAAVQEANALDGTDSIRVPAGDFRLDSSQALNITSNMTIQGASARTTIVRAFVSPEFGANDRVFAIRTGATVTLRRMTIRDGVPNVEAPEGNIGGNIYNAGTLRVLETIVRNGGARDGGGIGNVGGALTVELSTLVANVGISGVGTTSFGGAIVDLTSKPIPDPVTIDTSTISGNSADRGAGIFINSGAALNLVNSTISSNNAADTGGGLRMASGDAKVLSSIFADNTAKVDPTTSNCATGESGSISSSGFNLETAVDCDFEQATDQQNTDPALAALADNGGQTDTHALPRTSRAVDAGDPSCDGTDQRGVARPQGQACDVGAFELAAAAITSSVPASPANDNAPELRGTATAGSTVRIYTNATCTGTPAATGTAAAFGNPGLTVNVSNNTTTNFRATATDSAGNVSKCSAPFTYVEDSAAPGAPSITDSDPNSPANDNAPEIKGTAAAGSTVRLYTNATCTGTPVVTGTAAAFANPGLTANVANNTTTNFRATATDTAGNVSACSPAFTYVEDSSAPTTPSITDSDPNSPANDNAPEIKGTAEAGSTVRLYTNATCTGTPVATGTAAAFANPGFTVNVANNTTTNFRATATDAAGNLSPCSSAFAYVEDSAAPGAPSITDSDPNSPANDNAPEIKGTAAAGSTVRLYTNATCTGTPVATGAAAAFANPGLTATVANNTTTNFRATATDTAGNVSACSTPFTYVEDSNAPGSPTITGTDPGSPANDNDPEIKGTAEAGSTVRLYTNATCTGTPAATGTAAAFADPGLTVNVADNTTTNFRATARDTAGVTSACSDPLAYVEDSSAPNASLDPGFGDLTNDSTPSFTFASTEPGGSFRCRFDSAAFAACTSPHTPAGALGDGPHTFELEATDAAGNVDPTTAKRSFTVDTRPPETEIVSGPEELTTDSTPTFEFSSDEQGSRFECSIDGGSFTACSSPFTTPTLTSGAHTFVVRAIDASGNVDPSPALGFNTGAAQQQFTLIGQPAGPPSLGESFNAEAISGEIYVSVPSQTAVARAQAAQVPPGYESPIKGRVFVPLEEVRQLPVGSFVDTRFGTSQLTSARNRRGRLQTGKFSLGVFQVLQSRARRARGLTEIRMKGGNFRSCRAGKTSGSGSASAAQVRRRTIRRTRSSTSGRWGARGKHSAGTSRGTVWITADRCDGTLTTVKRGKVAVRDFRRKKTILVRAGKSYLAKAPR